MKCDCGNTKWKTECDGYVTTATCECCGKELTFNRHISTLPFLLNPQQPVEEFQSKIPKPSAEKTLPKKENKLLEKPKEPLVLEDTTIIRTNADRLVEYINRIGQATTTQAAQAIGTTEEVIYGWAKPLEEKSLIELKFSVLHGMVLKKPRWVLPWK